MEQKAKKKNKQKQTKQKASMKQSFPTVLRYWIDKTRIQDQARERPREHTIQ